MKVLAMIIGSACMVAGTASAESMASYDAMMQAGYALNAKDDTNGALAKFNEALTLARDASAAARAYNQIAAILKSKREFAEARQLLRNSLTTKGVDDGAKAEAQYLLAHSWIDEDKWDEAYTAWTKLLDMPGLWPYALSEARMIVGSGLLKQKQYNHTRRVLVQCVEEAGGIAWHKRDAQMNIVRSYVEEKRKQEAANALETLLAMQDVSNEMREEAEKLMQGLK